MLFELVAEFLQDADGGHGRGIAEGTKCFA
jgi:hypothetical protein